MPPLAPVRTATLHAAVRTATLHAAARTAALLGFAVLLGAGCNPGHHDVRSGPVEGGAICEAPADKNAICPGCSQPDATGLCRDRFYENEIRCQTDDGCGGSARCVGTRCVFHDADGDGFDDTLEREVAERNLPALRLSPAESCGGPRSIIYRSRPHPDAPARLAITYVVLYDRDCGELNGHLGDDEAFAITVDLDAAPGPAATVGIMTSAHLGTSCESDSSCETGPGMSLCAPSDARRTVVYSSSNKHANYLDVATCTGNCFDDCAPGPISLDTPLLDVGQPDLPLSRDLTESGVMQATMGWDSRLLHFDPWSLGTFGDAGHVRNQLLNLIAPAGLPTVDAPPPAIHRLSN